MGDNRGPDVLLGEAFAHEPSFVQNIDLSLGRDAADEMHAACTDGQLFRQHTAVLQPQPLSMYSTRQGSLRGSQAVQSFATSSLTRS